jgi:SAM-dependent methyltransferase
MRVLDIGCGTARILEQLPEIEYVGIDHNRRYISAAQQRFGSRGAFYLRDVNAFEFTSFGTFDRILLLGVLHHLNDGESIELMGKLATCLSPAGRLVTFDNALVKGHHPIATALSKLDRGRYSRSPENYRRIIESSLTVEKELVRHDLMRVPYSHAAFIARAVPQ